jgi:hypothetical protein
MAMRIVWIWPVATLLSVMLPQDSFASSVRLTPAGTCEIGSTSAAMPLLDAEPVNSPAGEVTAEVEEALRELPGRETRWIDAPGLVILTSVMDYRTGTRTEYEATSERVAAEEVDRLVKDLTTALTVLTDNTFTRFATIRVEVANAGETVNVMRPGQIVVGRYRGVRDQLKTIGVGGRFRSGRAIKAGTVFLDEDYDRTSEKRALLRTHELGHALGYDHVDARPSIMNPRIGADITDYDRLAARVAFRPSTVPASCPSV